MRRFACNHNHAIGWIDVACVFSGGLAWCKFDFDFMFWYGNWFKHRAPARGAPYGWGRGNWFGDGIVVWNRVLNDNSVVVAWIYVAIRNTIQVMSSDRGESPLKSSMVVSGGQ
jgi:hypothetical protein